MKNYVHAKQLPVASRPSVFQSPDEDEEEDYEQWLEIKGEVRGCCPPPTAAAQPRRQGPWPPGTHSRG